MTTENKWEQWILYILKAVEETSIWTTNKISAIKELEEHTIEYISNNLPKIYRRELVDIIFEQPYCRINNLVKADIAKRETASKYLKQLENIGVLQEEKEGRNKLYIHPKLMDLLTKDVNKFKKY